MEKESSQEIPLLTYNSLYNLLREEKKTKTLQILPELFYEAEKKFLEDKNNEIKKLKNSQEIEKIRKEKNILKNSIKIIEELLSLRCSKIANIAIKNELLGEEILSKKGILKKEEIFLESVIKATKKLKND